MKHEADLVEGPLYNYLGHFGQREFLEAGHNTSKLSGESSQSWGSILGEMFGSAAEDTGPNPVGRTALAREQKGEKGMKLTPSEHNAIYNMESGRNTYESKDRDI